MIPLEIQWKSLDENDEMHGSMGWVRWAKKKVVFSFKKIKKVLSRLNRLNALSAKVKNKKTNGLSVPHATDSRLASRHFAPRAALHTRSFLLPLHAPAQKTTTRRRTHSICKRFIVPLPHLQIQFRVLLSLRSLSRSR